MLESTARQRPTSPALLSPDDEPISYQALFDFVADTVRILHAQGFAKGDRVALVLSNGPEMASAFLSTTAFTICAPLNPAHSAKEFRFLLADLRAAAVIVQEGLDTVAPEVARAMGLSVIHLQPRRGEAAGTFDLRFEKSRQPKDSVLAEATDGALLLHTSGTTAQPKRVVLTHANLCAAAAGMCQVLALTPADRCLNVMPLFHIHGLSTIYASLAAGASVVCPPAFLAPRFFDWLAAFQPSWYTAAPTIHQALLAHAPRHRETLRRHPLRFIRSASASLPPTLAAALETSFQAPVVVAYGMTETSPQISSQPLPPAPRTPGSVGHPVGCEVAILDETGQPRPPGHPGEVAVRGPNVLAAYEDNALANQAAFVHGWFKTGDLGFLSPDGELFITGRLKEIINRGGEKISPREVDEVLLEHPSVAQAVCFAVPDDRLGEDIAAAVVLRDKHQGTERELREFVSQRLAFFKVPSRILFVPEIPKGHTGKIQRIGLAEKLGISFPAAETLRNRERFVAPRNPLEEILAGIWAEVLALPQISVHDDFFQLGGDSVLAVLLLSRIRERMHTEVSLLEFFEHLTLAELADLIVQKEIADIDPETLEHLLTELEGGIQPDVQSKTAEQR